MNKYSVIAALQSLGIDADETQRLSRLKTKLKKTVILQTIKTLNGNTVNRLCRKYNINTRRTLDRKKQQIITLYKDDPALFCGDFPQVPPAFVSFDAGAAAVVNDMEDTMEDMAVDDPSMATSDDDDDVQGEQGNGPTPSTDSAMEASEQTTVHTAPVQTPGAQGDQGESLLQQLQVSERERLGLPPVQQMLRLTNDSNTECYANAGLGVLLSNPLVSRYLARLSPSHPLVLTLRSLSLQDPSTISSLQALRNRIAEVLPRVQFLRQTVQQQDSHEFILALIEALEICVTDEEKAELNNLHQIKTEKLYKCIGSQDLSLLSPEHLRRHPPDIHDVLSLPVLHPVTREPLHSVQECLSRFLDTENVVRNCHVENCPSTQSVQYTRISTQPQVY